MGPMSDERKLSEIVVPTIDGIKSHLVPDSEGNVTKQDAMAAGQSAFVAAIAGKPIHIEEGFEPAFEYVDQFPKDTVAQLWHLFKADKTPKMRVGDAKVIAMVGFKLGQYQRS